MELKYFFSEYYKKAKFYINNIHQREFAIGFNEKIEKRHLAFFSEQEFRHFLVTHTPFYVSNSIAYYERPGAEMKEKGFIKAELAFDLDAKEGLDKIDKLKAQVNMILDILKYDFGAKDILLAFSGNRGFHIYVRDENIMQLNGNERKILLEYILGSGFDYEMLFNINGQKIVGPKPTESGYRGRFARKTIEMIKNNKAFAKNFGRDENEINDFLDGIENGLWSKTRKRNIIEKLKPVSDAITIKESFIDPPVTYDLSKLMRVVNSLHGSTGFRVLPIKDIDAFNIQDAYAFSDEKIEIVASDDIEPNKVIDLKEKIKKGGILKVPLYAAIFLVCQKKAIIKI